MDRLHHNNQSPTSPYYKETRNDTTIIIEEELSKCPMCCEFFDPEQRINNGKIIYNPKREFGTEPVFWTDQMCDECKNNAT